MILGSQQGLTDACAICFVYKDALLRGHEFGLKFSLRSTHCGPFVVVLPGDGTLW